MDKSAIIENFNKIWNQHYNKIYAYCYTKLQNPTDVDDCIQDTFSALFIKMLKGNVIITPEAWLYSCARKQACKLNKKARREIPDCSASNISIIDHIAYYDEYFVDEKSNDEIEAYKSIILEKLSKDEQDLINKVYMQRIKICEIAAEYDISPNALSHKLCRLKKKILKYIYEINYY